MFQQLYSITLEGATALLVHQDNLSWAETMKLYERDPANKKLTTPGDDRTPAWRWIGYLYFDGGRVVMPSDNLMTMLREGGSKVLKKGSETFKKQTQSGINLDQQQWDLTVKGETISMDSIKDLIGNMEFIQHIETAEALGFELLVKRAKIGAAKHVRVRPMFREWTLTGSLTVLDDEMTGLKKPILDQIFRQAGALCGLGDWRPSSPKASGTFGMFSHEIKKM